MTFFAQIASDLQPFAGQGILGAIFAWLALRLEKKVDRNNAAVEWLCTLHMMEMSSSDHIGVGAKKLIKERMAKMGVRADE